MKILQLYEHLLNISTNKNKTKFICSQIYLKYYLIYKHKHTQNSKFLQISSLIQKIIFSSIPFTSHKLTIFEYSEMNFHLRWRATLESNFHISAFATYTHKIHHKEKKNKNVTFFYRWVFGAAAQRSSASSLVKLQPVPSLE